MRVVLMRLYSGGDGRTWQDSPAGIWITSNTNIVTTCCGKGRTWITDWASSEACWSRTIPQL